MNVREDSSQRGCVTVQGKLYPVYDGLNPIGRNPEATINIKNLNISQHHAVITIIDGNSHYISDFKSSNGTIVDGMKLEPLRLYPLNNGASIKFADLFCTYRKFSPNTQTHLDTPEASQALNDDFYNMGTQNLDHDLLCSNGVSFNEMATQVVPPSFNELPTQVCSYDDTHDSSSGESVDLLTMEKIGDSQVSKNNTSSLENGNSPFLSQEKEEQILTPVHPVRRNKRNVIESDSESDEEPDKDNSRSRYILSDSETDIEDDSEGENKSEQKQSSMLKDIRQPDQEKNNANIAEDHLYCHTKSEPSQSEESTQVMDSSEYKNLVAEIQKGESAELQEDNFAAQDEGTSPPDVDPDKSVDCSALKDIPPEQQEESELAIIQKPEKSPQETKPSSSKVANNGIDSTKERVNGKHLGSQSSEINKNNLCNLEPLDEEHASTSNFEYKHDNERNLEEIEDDTQDLENSHEAQTSLSSKAAVDSIDSTKETERKEPEVMDPSEDENLISENQKEGEECALMEAVGGGIEAIGKHLDLSTTLEINEKESPQNLDSLDGEHPSTSNFEYNNDNERNLEEIEDDTQDLENSQEAQSRSSSKLADDTIDSTKERGNGKHLDLSTSLGTNQKESPQNLESLNRNHPLIPKFKPKSDDECNQDEIEDDTQDLELSMTTDVDTSDLQNDGDESCKSPSLNRYYNSSDLPEASATNSKARGTQKLDFDTSGASDAFYLSPTQELPQRPTAGDDVYLQPTQQLNLDAPSTSTRSRVSDEFYILPTQPIPRSSTSTPFEPQPSTSKEPDGFLKPTKLAPLTKSPRLRAKAPVKDDDDFLQPTQALESLYKDELTEENRKSPEVEQELEMMFATQSLMATQQLVDVLEKPPEDEVVDDSLMEPMLSSQSVRSILLEDIEGESSGGRKRKLDGAEDEANVSAKFLKSDDGESGEDARREVQTRSTGRRADKKKDKNEAPAAEKKGSTRRGKGKKSAAEEGAAQDETDKDHADVKSTRRGRARTELTEEANKKDDTRDEGRKVAKKDNAKTSQKEDEEKPGRAQKEAAEGSIENANNNEDRMKMSSEEEAVLPGKKSAAEERAAQEETSKNQTDVRSTRRGRPKTDLTEASKKDDTRDEGRKVAKKDKAKTSQKEDEMKVAEIVRPTRRGRAQKEAAEENLESANNNEDRVTMSSEEETVLPEKKSAAEEGAAQEETSKDQTDVRSTRRGRPKTDLTEEASKKNDTRDEGRKVAKKDKATTSQKQDEEKVAELVIPTKRGRAQKEAAEESIENANNNEEVKMSSEKEATVPRSRRAPKKINDDQKENVTAESSTTLQSRPSTSADSGDEFEVRISSTPKRPGRKTGQKSKLVPILEDNDTPPAEEPKKKRRLSANSRQRKNEDTKSNESILGTPNRSRRQLKPKVVFTMMDDPSLEATVRHLGGLVVDTVDACTVLVTGSVKRSQKLLCAVGQGKPICSPAWIHACKSAHAFVDPWEHILLDKEAEKKWDFSLKESLARSSKKKLLENYTFQLIVDTAADVLKGAIESCGGSCVTRNLAKAETDYIIVVSTIKNKTKFKKIALQNPKIVVVEPEAIFEGVLRQELRFNNFLLI